LPPLRDNKTVDSYFILWSSDKPKEEHKSKIHKKDLNPKFNETFGLKYDQKVVKNGVLTGTIHFQFRNFKKVGMQFLGKEFTIPFQLKEGEERDQWIPIPDTSTNGEVSVNIRWTNLKVTEIPEIIKTHTGGSTATYYNSITRSQLKKRIRQGDRGMDSEVEFLTVKVHEAKNLVFVNADSKSSDPYFSVFLHSSQQIVYKTKPVKNTVNPKWEDAEYGFELVTVLKDKVRDALKLQFKSSSLIGDSVSLGTLYIPLDFLEPNAKDTKWYKLEGVASGEVKLTVGRGMKKVSELPIQATSGSASVSKKLIYALTLVKQQMVQFGMKCTITISLKMAVVATRVSICIDPSSTVNTALLEQEVQNAEQAVDTEPEDTPEEEDPETKSVFKKMLIGAVLALGNNLRNSLRDMKAVGLNGSLGCSVILGVPMYGIEFEIAVDVELV